MKKLLIILCLIAMVFCFTGCDKRDQLQYEAVNNMVTDMDFVVIEEISHYGDTYIYLVYDSETNVEYILVDGYCETSLCPRYNRNGDVMVHKGE